MLFAALLATGTKAQTPELALNQQFSLKPPFIRADGSSALEGRWVVSFDAVDFSAQDSSLRSAELGGRFFARSLQSFSLDDSLDLRIEFNFEGKEARGAVQEESVLLLQLTEYLSLIEAIPLGSLLLHGLAIALYQREGAAFLTHRFFAEEVNLRAGEGVLTALFGRRDADNSCEIPNFLAIKGLRLVASADELRVEYQTGGQWLHCFSLPLPRPAALYLDLQILMGTKKEKTFALQSVELWQRPHALDLDSTLLVSHGLVEEIFDKVAHFGARLDAQKGALGRMGETLSEFGKLTARLEAYAHDLSHGTTLFQSAVMAAFAAQRGSSPQDLPRLQRAREGMDRLEESHGRIYARLAEMRRLAQSKNNFRKTTENIEHAVTKLEELQRLSAEPRFAEAMEEINALSGVLASVDVEGVIAQLQGLEATTLRKHTRMGLAAALGMTALVVVAALLLARKITLTEQKMFL